MKKINVLFQGGQSRYGDSSCDFMLAELANGGELYAEVNPEDYLSDDERAEWEAEQREEAEGGRPADWCRFEDMVEERVYEALKAEILAQAETKGISAEVLEF